MASPVSNNAKQEQPKDQHSCAQHAAFIKQILDSESPCKNEYSEACKKFAEQVEAARSACLKR